MEMDLDRLLPATEAAMRANVSKQVFNYWRRAGKVKPAEFDKRGRALYRARDALKAERDARRSGRSHRRPLGEAA